MSQNSIKIEQIFPLDYFGKQTIEVKDGKVLRNYKNIFREFNKSYDINTIDPNTLSLKQADRGWENLVWFFAITAFIYTMVDEFTHSSPLTNLVVIFSLLFIALICFLFKFKKYDNIFFSDYSGNYLFGIKISQKSEKEKAFINELVSAIKSAKNQTN